MQPEPGRELRIARWSKRCSVLGPGVRAVVWVQGCPFRCPGCVAPESLPFEGGEIIGVNELAEQILALEDIQGVTFSGGEPMSQAFSLSNLAKILHDRRDFSVMSYSGFTLEQLLARGTNQQKRFLSELDILVDGLYVHERHTDLIWRGSDNQRVIFLSRRHEEWKSKMSSPGPGVEFEFEHDAVSWMGVPPKGFREQFEDQLQRLHLLPEDENRA